MGKQNKKKVDKKSKHKKPINNVPELKGDYKDYFDKDSIAEKRYNCAKEHINNRLQMSEIVKKYGVEDAFVKDAVKRFKQNGGIHCFKDDDDMKDPHSSTMNETGTNISLTKKMCNLFKGEKDKNNTNDKSTDERKKMIPNKSDTNDTEKSEEGKYSDIDSINKNQTKIFEKFQTKIFEKIETIEKSLKNDLSKIYGFQESIQAIKNKFDDSSQFLENISNYSSSTKTNLQKQTKMVESVQNIVKQLPSNMEIKRSQSDVSSRLKNIEEDISDLTMDIPKKLKFIEQSFDLLQGKLGSLDDIQETLKDKGISIRQEFPPTGEEEDVIIQLAKYGEKILNHLTIAARHYARNRQDISRAGHEKHLQELQKEQKKSFKNGKSEGKIETVEDLIKQFDLGSLFNSKSQEGQTIVAFLKNNGLIEDEELVQDTVIEIDEKNRGQLEVKAKFQGLGAFSVKKSCLKLGGKIIRKAELEANEGTTERNKKSKTIPDIQIEAEYNNEKGMKSEVSPNNEEKASSDQSQQDKDVITNENDESVKSSTPDIQIEAEYNNEKGMKSEASPKFIDKQVHKTDNVNIENDEADKNIYNHENIPVEQSDEEKVSPDQSQQGKDDIKNENDESVKSSTPDIQIEAEHNNKKGMKSEASPKFIDKQVHKPDNVNIENDEADKNIENDENIPVEQSDEEKASSDQSQQGKDDIKNENDESVESSTSGE
ncbi:hypothetical protein QUF70_04415 [Desulfobacterales bacterium HSG17]|nr:hypothetical protein [Desulfobacterales bacterium HSG17]